MNNIYILFIYVVVETVLLFIYCKVVVLQSETLFGQEGSDKCPELKNLKSRQILFYNCIFLESLVIQRNNHNKLLF